MVIGIHTINFSGIVFGFERFFNKPDASVKLDCTSMPSKAYKLWEAAV